MSEYVAVYPQLTHPCVLYVGHWSSTHGRVQAGKEQTTQATQAEQCNLREPREQTGWQAGADGRAASRQTG